MCLIAPVTPNQNLYVESYNGRFRYESLNEHWCTSLAHAKVRIDGWRREDYEERPTKGLAGLTPAPLRQAVGSETQYRHPRDPQPKRDSKRGDVGWTLPRTRPNWWSTCVHLRRVRAGILAGYGDQMGDQAHL